MDQPAAVNGEARTNIAVLDQRMSDCQRASWQRLGKIEKTLEKLDTRLDEVDRDMARLKTTLGIWAAVGAFTASILVQALFRLLG